MSYRIRKEKRIMNARMQFDISVLYIEDENFTCEVG